MNIGAPWPGLSEAKLRVHAMQTKLHRWAISETRPIGVNSWRAGCGESRTSGSEGGPGKPTGSNSGRAPRSDPYTQHPTRQGWVYVAVVIDAWSRLVVGHAIADHLRTELVVDALQTALWRRQPAAGVATTP